MGGGRGGEGRRRTASVGAKDCRPDCRKLGWTCCATCLGATMPALSSRVCTLRTTGGCCISGRPAGVNALALTSMASRPTEAGDSSKHNAWRYPTIFRMSEDRTDITVFGGSDAHAGTYHGTVLRHLIPSQNHTDLHTDTCVRASPRTPRKPQRARTSDGHGQRACVAWPMGGVASVVESLSATT